MTASALNYDYPEKAFWEGVIGKEEIATGDGRFIEDKALRWDTPIPIRHTSEDIGAHDGARVVGRILEIERRDNGDIYGFGDFDMDSEVGRESFRHVAEGLTTGISMDLDEMEYTVKVRAEIAEEIQEASEGLAAESKNTPEKDKDGYVSVFEYSPSDEIMSISDALIRAATIVAIPAFKQAKISISKVKEVEIEEDGAEELSANSEEEEQTFESLLASAIPVEPPAEWFNAPNLTGPTPLQVLKNGQIFGHLATWGTCHLGNPEGVDRCTEAPKSKTDYAYFHTGTVLTSEGSAIPVGQITMTTGHAGPRENAARAAYHYDNTGAVVADVQVGEDSFGIWISGALRSGVTPDQIRELRAAPLSGDWRSIGGNLELVAALAVNVPGFPIPRERGLVASGEHYSLVAAGMLAPRSASDSPEDIPENFKDLSHSDIEYLKRLANSERNRDVEQYAHKVKKIAKATKLKNFLKSGENYGVRMQ